MDHNRHHFAQAGLGTSFPLSQLRLLRLLGKCLAEIIDLTEQFEYTHFGHLSLMRFWFRNLILHQNQGIFFSIKTPYSG
jgi:hypothetical protein